jgi:hypothetical protein
LIRISRFKNEFDSHPVLVEVAWPDLARELTTHDFTRKTKKGLPCFSPAEFMPDAPTKQAKYVLRVSLGVIDLDDISNDEVMRVSEAVRGLSACWYTTWSHAEAVKKDRWRLRVVVPFSRPVEVREWPTFWPRMVDRLGGICDTKCSNPDRVFYLPCMPPGSESMAWSLIQ